MSLATGSRGYIDLAKPYTKWKAIWDDLVGEEVTLKPQKPRSLYHAEELVQAVFSKNGNTTFDDGNCFIFDGHKLRLERIPDDGVSGAGSSLWYRVVSAETTPNYDLSELIQNATIEIVQYINTKPGLQELFDSLEISSPWWHLFDKEYKKPDFWSYKK